MKVIAIDHGGAALRATRLIAAIKPSPPVITTRTPATQLEIAAHWLEELSVGHDQRDNLLRVARECKAVAYREGK